MTSAILLLLVLGLVQTSRAANWNRTLDKRVSDARFTFYDAGLGACGGTNDGSDFIVALNAEQYGNGEHCYKTIEITYNGKTAHAQVVDECPDCPYGALDFSRALFDHFASEDLGVIYGSWVFGDSTQKPTTTAKKTTTTKHTTTRQETIRTTGTSTGATETTATELITTSSSRSSSTSIQDDADTASATSSSSTSAELSRTVPTTAPSTPTVAGALGTQPNAGQRSLGRTELYWLLLGAVTVACT